jgi:hypothetical protein
VEGVQFASEVAAIQNNSGLTAAHIAKDQAYHLERAAQKVLHIARAYDEEPISIPFQGQLLVYNAKNPVRLRINPDSQPVVSEDALRYEPRDARISKAVQMLGICGQPTIMQAFPSAIQKAFEELLRAAGVRDIEGWMQAPQMGGMQQIMGLIQQHPEILQMLQQGGGASAGPGQPTAGGQPAIAGPGAAVQPNTMMMPSSVAQKPAMGSAA